MAVVVGGRFPSGTFAAGGLGAAFAFTFFAICQLFLVGDNAPR